jgi:hypothetical protein
MRVINGFKKVEAASTAIRKTCKDYLWMPSGQWPW